MSEDTRNVKQISLQDHYIKTEDGYRVYSIACNAHDSLDALETSSHSLLVPVDEAGQVSDDLKGIVRIYADCAHINECDTGFSMIPDFHDPSQIVSAFKHYEAREDTRKRQSLPSDWRSWTKEQSRSPHITWFEGASNVEGSLPDGGLIWQLDDVVQHDQESGTDPQATARRSHSVWLVPVTSNLMDGNGLLVEKDEADMKASDEQLRKWNSATPVEGNELPLELATGYLHDPPTGTGYIDDLADVRDLKFPEGWQSSQSTTTVRNTLVTRAVGTIKRVGGLLRSKTKDGSGSDGGGGASGPISRVTSNEGAIAVCDPSDEITTGSWRNRKEPPEGSAS